MNFLLEKKVLRLTYKINFKMVQGVPVNPALKLYYWYYITLSIITRSCTSYF